MNFMTFHVLGIVIPTDELIFFRGVGWNHQPDYIDWIHIHTHIIPYLPPCQVSCRSLTPISLQEKPGWFQPCSYLLPNSILGSTWKSQVPIFIPPNSIFPHPPICKPQTQFWSTPIFIPSKTFRPWPRRIRFVWWRQPPDLACPAVTLQRMALRTPSTATRWQAGWPTATSAATKPGARGPTGHRGGKYGRGIKCIKHQQNWGYPVCFLFFFLTGCRCYLGIFS